MTATFVTTQLTNVESNLQDVTPEQIGKCTKVYDFSTQQWFYLVENSRNEVNADGDLIEYRVTWSNEKGFQCSCPSGQAGFYNVGHPSGTCQHVRWSVACRCEEQEATREHSLLIDNKPVSQAQYERVVKAPAKKSHGNAKAYQPKAFSLLK